MTPDTTARIDPSTTALLIMDYQNGLVSQKPEFSRLLDGARETIALARSRGATIGYVRVAFADRGEIGGAMGRRVGGAEVALARLGDELPDTQIHDAVAPAPGDVVVRKTRVGPFGTTDLHEQLSRRGVDTLLLAGISTSGVVLSTVRDAHDRDYRLVVLADLCADRDDEVHRVLTEKVFPTQGDVIDSTQLEALLR